MKILSVLLFQLQVLFYFTSFAGEIRYPWRATTVFVESGGSFHILYDNINSLPIDSVVLVGPFNRINLEIDSVNVGRFEYDHYTKFDVNNRIWVNVPESAPEDFYDLIVYCGGEVSKSPKSVKVLKEFNRAFSFIHISDLHLTRQWVGAAESGYAKELELLDGFIKVANIIAPDFYLITGDIIMDYTMFDADSTGWGGYRNYEAGARPSVEEKYKNVFYGANGFSGLYDFGSPFFLIPGNHDYYGIRQDEYYKKAAQWNHLCGKRLHGFSYGDARIILTDDALGDPENEIPKTAPMSGMQGKIHEKFLQDNGEGLIRIMAQHHHDAIDTTFLNENKIDILLNGHNHTPHQQILGETPTHVVRSGVVCRSGEINNWKKNLGFFRIFFVSEDGQFKYTDPLRFCNNPTASYNDLELNLQLHFLNANDGTSDKNEAVIMNSFEFGFPRCKIRFVMKKGNYHVDGGEVHQIIQTDNLSVVDVFANVDSNANKTVEIYPKD